MIFTKGIKALMSANSDVTDIVGTKIYPLQAPSGTALPFVTYEVISSDVTHTKEKADFDFSRMEIVGYTATYSEACTLIQKLKETFARASYNVGGIVIDKIFIEQLEIEFYENPNRYAAVLEIKAFVPL
tara:strand:+ start:207 stop:593 length:387 start_codon:yes stop_codon:yes gene_type:complete